MKVGSNKGMGRMVISLELSIVFSRLKLEV